MTSNSPYRYHLNILPLLVLGLLFSFLLVPTHLQAQETELYDDGYDEEYFEFSLFLNVQRVGGTELPALIHEEYVLLSIVDLFDFLKIKREVTPGFNQVSGFFIDESNHYLINRESNTIEYKGDKFLLAPGDLVRSETGLYLKSDKFGEIFGLNCYYNFRNLTVTLKSDIELPVIREMRLLQMRKNIRQLTGDLTADTTVRASFPIIKFGMADWSVSSTQVINETTTTSGSLRLGAALLGGGLELSLQQNFDRAFEWRNQRYQWRWANNNLKAIRQIELGKLNSYATTTLGSHLIGASLTNAPTTYRGTYGTMTINDFTEPEWTVELYINNTLVDYQKADASGFFSFEVPLVYGSTAIRLLYYGPWGEVREEEKLINIPYTLLPKGKVEYRVTGGALEDSTYRKFGRASLNVGLSNFLTIGGGAEYASAVTDYEEQFIPYLTASGRIGGTLVYSATYDHNTAFRGDMHLRLPANIQLNFNYINYHEGQTAIRTSYKEERRLALSLPIRVKRFALGTTFTFNNSLTQFSQFYSGNLNLTTSLLGINVSLSTIGQKYSSSGPLDLQGRLNLSTRIPGQILLSSNVRFNYRRGDVEAVGVNLQRYIRHKLYIGAEMEHGITAKYTTIGIALRYDFPFARFGFNARKRNKSYTLSQSASGSLLLDGYNRYLGADIRGAVGRGGVVFHPFIDINGNGKRDKGEPMAEGVNVMVNGGQIRYNEKDTTIRVSGLEAYTDYYFTLSDVGLDNIAWKLQNKTMRIASEPNQFRNIYLPISVLGEATGMVYLTRGKSTVGLGRVIINIHNRNDSTLVSKILTEEDGYFSYLGLAPGSYYATLDKEQLVNISMESEEMTIEFEVEEDLYGDYVDNLDFYLTPTPSEEESKQTNTVRKTDDKKSNKKELISQIKDGDTFKKCDETHYRVQLLALRKNRYDKKSLYNFLQPLWQRHSDMTVLETLGSDNLYRYSVGNFAEKQQASKLLLELKRESHFYKDAFISSFIPKIEEHSISRYLNQEQYYND